MIRTYITKIVIVLTNIPSQHPVHYLKDKIPIIKVSKFDISTLNLWIKGKIKALNKNLRDKN